MTNESKDGILLSEAINQMKSAILHSDLSDEYLKYNGNETRNYAFCGEWAYGISMVPCSFAIQLARKVLEKEGDQFIPFE